MDVKMPQLVSIFVLICVKMWLHTENQLCTGLP